MKRPDFGLFPPYQFSDTSAVDLLPYMAPFGILGFAGVSFYFALAESALFSLGKWRAQHLAGRSGGRGDKVIQLLKEPQDLLATIVLGNTLANAGLVATALWLALKGAWPIAISIAGVLALVLIGCEVIPKALAVRAPEVWSLRLAASMLWLTEAMRPARRIAQGLNNRILRAVIPRSVKPQTTLSDEEYQELIEMAYQQGSLARSEKEFIQQIISLDRRTVKDVMRMRSQMACIPDDLSIEEMIAAARRLNHHRVPLYDETPDTIVGVLNTRVLLLDPQVDLAEAIEFPSFVPESMNLLHLFRSFQRQRRALAIVLDEFGGTAGLVTMEDILEQVVGELHSEGEVQSFVMEKLGEGRWRVSGTMRVDEFRRHCPQLPQPIADVDTMGGFLIAHLNVVPVQGDSATIGAVKMTAAAVDERRVRELLVEDVKRKGGR